jgi:hypothetical protein
VSQLVSRGLHLVSAYGHRRGGAPYRGPLSKDIADEICEAPGDRCGSAPWNDPAHRGRPEVAQTRCDFAF